MQQVAPTQTASARTLRTSMTDAERKLWHALRSSQLGVKFRHQHPIDRYIADFVCLEPKLVIEIDGGQHADDAIRDAHRTTILEAHGFKVIRFWNNEVLQNLDGVVRVIAQELTPHPHPPCRARQPLHRLAVPWARRMRRETLTSPFPLKRGRKKP